MNISNVFNFQITDTTTLANVKGRISIIVFKDSKLDRSARRLNRLTRGGLERIVSDEKFE